MKKKLQILILCLLSALPVLAQENVLLLDSIVTYKIFLPDSSHYWKRCIEYDNLGRPLKDGEYRTYDNARTWQTEKLTQNVYDQDGNAVKVETFRRAVPYTFVDEYFHYEKTYDLQGNLKIDSISIRNPDREEWHPWVRYEYSYNETGLLTARYSWHWSSRDMIWNQPQKTEYIYNDNNNILLVNSYFWNGNNWNLSSHYKQTYEYDQSGRLSKHYYSTIDYDIPVDMLIEYTYPTDTSRNVGTFKHYNNDTAYWCFSMEEELYSAEGLLLSNVTETLNAGGVLAPTEKITWQYDESGNPVLSTLYDRIRDEWKIQRRSTYYYSYLSNVHLIEDHTVINIFPNPTSGTIHITGLDQPADIRIYSMQGKFMKSESRVMNYFDVSELPAGVYIINIQSSEDSIIRMIVKE